MIRYLLPEKRFLVEKGSQFQIGIIDNDPTNTSPGGVLSWRSVDPFVTVVDNNGYATAMNLGVPGTPNIIVETQDGSFKGLIYVVVLPNEYWLKGIVNMISVENGSDYSLDYKYLVKNGSSFDFRVKKAILDFNNGSKLEYIDPETLDVTIYSHTPGTEIFSFNTSTLLADYGTPPERWDTYIYLQEVLSGEIFFIKNTFTSKRDSIPI